MGAAVVGIVIALAVVVWCVGGFAVARAVGGAFASGAGRVPEKDAPGRRPGGYQGQVPLSIPVAPPGMSPQRRSSRSSR